MVIACKPYGNPKQAQVFVIGHDPLLQRSEAKAETAFYLDYLERDYPTRQGERRKYELARAVVDYIRHLAGGSLEC